MGKRTNLLVLGVRRGSPRSFPLGGSWGFSCGATPAGGSVGGRPGAGTDGGFTVGFSCGAGPDGGASCGAAPASHKTVSCKGAMGGTKGRTEGIYGVQAVGGAVGWRLQKATRGPFYKIKPTGDPHPPWGAPY